MGEIVFHIVFHVFIVYLPFIVFVYREGANTYFETFFFLFFFSLLSHRHSWSLDSFESPKCFSEILVKNSLNHLLPFD